MGNNYDELIDIFINKIFSGNKDAIIKYKQDIAVIVKDLCDSSKIVVSPLNITDTYIIREYYGLINDVKKSKVDIAKEIDLLDENIDYRLFLIFNNIKYAVMNKDNNVKNRLSVLDLCRDDDLKNKVIGYFNFSSLLHSRLIKDNIYNLEELLGNSLIYYEIKGYKKEMINELKDSIHKIGLCFIDELSDSDREAIIYNCSDKEKILNSDIAFLNLSDNSLKYLKKRMIYSGIKDIDDIRSLGNAIKELNIKYFDIINQIKKYNLSFIWVPSINNEDILNASIKAIGISDSAIKNLRRHKISTLRDLISFSKKDIFSFVNSSLEEYNNIVNRVYVFGYGFSDDINIIF